MKHYKITKNMTSKALTNYIRENLRVGDVIRHQGISCIVIAKFEDYFWVKNNTWTRPMTVHPSDIDIMEGM